MSNVDVFIVGAARTPIGSFQGSLSSLESPKLGAVAIKAAVERANVPVDAINEVIMGCVLPAGVGQAPARQAMLGAGLNKETHALTINKVCASGLKAAMLASTKIKAGEADVVVAGGMESMSLTPYYLPKARQGYRMGNQTAVDGMIHDGLWDPYNNFHMGSAGEMCAEKYNFSREAQDAFAAESYRRAQKSVADGVFNDEIAPVEVPQRKGDPLVIDTDEEPSQGSPDKLGGLRPAFAKDGTITAGNASTLNDGGSAIVVASAAAVKQHGLKPLAKIVGYSTNSHEPEWFTTAPVGAVQKLLAQLNWTAGDVDLYEINEAFAVVTMAALKELNISHDKVNVHGGAVALGHPIGASGSRILVTLIHALKRAGKTRGIATLCNGGGEAVAVAVEIV